MGYYQVDQYIDYRGLKRRKKGTESLFEEIMDKKFSNLGKETDIQVQEAQEY